MKALYYTIDADKLEKITLIVNEEIDPRATESDIEDLICADWSEGNAHQQWINTAKPQEIADWISSFYGESC